MSGRPQSADVGDAQDNSAEVRDRILRTASTLFYQRGVRAVGVDLVVEEAGVAKTSLYRHFRTKDDLIAAFLQREDEDFWNKWSRVTELRKADPVAELEAHLDWIAERVGRPNYRGCPQLNVAAEFPDSDHPARKVAVSSQAGTPRAPQGDCRATARETPRRTGRTIVAADQRSFREFAASFAGRGRPAPTRHRTCSDCCRS